MGRMCTLLVGLGGCFAPAPVQGVACGPGDTCPSGQWCIASVCSTDGVPESDALIPDSLVVTDAAVDAPVILGAWSTPTKIPGVNSTSAEGDPSLTPDLLTICFSSARNAGMADDIFIGTRMSTADPFVVAAVPLVNTASNERSCEISADGGTIYFTSNRSGNDDVFVSVKVGGIFGAPSPVTELTTAVAESDIALSPDGKTAMIARGNDLYLTSKPDMMASFTQPLLVPELDVTGNVAAPSITDNANAVYLHAGTPTRDLYVAYRQGQSFATPVLIMELSTAARDAAPFVSNDERYIAFEGVGELFEATR